MCTTHYSLLRSFRLLTVYFISTYEGVSGASRKTGTGFGLPRPNKLRIRRMNHSTSSSQQDHQVLRESNFGTKNADRDRDSAEDELLVRRQLHMSAGAEEEENQSCLSQQQPSSSQGMKTITSYFKKMQCQSQSSQSQLMATQSSQCLAERGMMDHDAMGTPAVDSSSVPAAPSTSQDPNQSRSPPQLSRKSLRDTHATRHTRASRGGGGAGSFHRHYQQFGGMSGAGRPGAGGSGKSFTECHLSSICNAMNFTPTSSYM